MKNLVQFKSFFKFLQKHKLFTFIEIFGMSVSLMFVLLIASYTWQELSIDKFQEKADRIYVLANEKYFGSTYRLGEVIKDRYPEIEQVCGMLNYFRKSPVSIGEEKFTADLIFTDTTFFSMFSFDIQEGDRVNPMSARNYAVISRSFANKAFPGKNPLGQVIEIEKSVKLTVNAVMEDIRNSVVPNGDVIVRIDNLEEIAPWQVDEGMYSYGATALFFLEKEGANLPAKADDLLAYLKANLRVYEHHLTEAYFVPLKEIYFSGMEGPLEQGDRTFVLILLSIGLLILLFAVINYVNLSVSQTGFRAKEMAMRRLMGSSRKELFIHLIAESTLVSFVSFGVGMFLAFAALPFVNNLLQTVIDLRGMISPVTILLALLIIVGMGILAGILPALIISGAKPVEVVKGTFRRQTKMVFSKVFITFQNVITIALVTASVTMIIQINYLIKAPLGYNTTNIIDIPVFGLDSKEQSLLLAKEIEKLAVVNRVGLSRGMPFHQGDNYTMKYEDREISFQRIDGDPTFIDMLGIKILRDNNLASGDGYYLSELSLQELGIGEDSPTFLFYEEPQPIAGIVRNFQLSNILFENRPVLMRIRNEDRLEIRHVVVEISGNSHDAMGQVKRVYEQLTKLEFPGQFIDQQIDQSFTRQKRTSQILVLFAGVAIVLSFLGLLAMSIYFIQQRSREIAVRKIFGSDNIKILKEVISTFLSYVVIAFVIVTPFSWYFLKEWLSGYAYRIPLHPGIFILSGFFCLLIAFCTVFWQSYYAANSNPVESIKAE